MRRNAGAISESVGEYGNHVVLVTPIEEMLRDPPATPPARLGARRQRARALRAAARRVLDRLRPLAAHARTCSPAPPAGGHARCWPRPRVRSAASRGRSSCPAPRWPRRCPPATSHSARSGTVTYRDGARIWAFGHAFEGLGRRSLFLEDAYVFGVISNPFTLPDFGAGTYKLTSAGGHVQGTVSSDAVASIAGTVGDPPAGIPLEVVARESGGDGRVVKLDSQLADERSLGFGAGLSFAAPLGASQALEQLLRNFGPATVSMCFRVKLAGRAKSLGYCNPYFDAFTPLDDLIAATSLVRRLRPAAPAIERAVGEHPRTPRRQVGRADLRAGAPPGGGRQAGARTGDAAAPERRPPHAQRSGSHPARPAARPAHAAPVGHQRWGRLGRGEPSCSRSPRSSTTFGGGSEPRTTGELARRIAAVHQDAGISARIRRGDDHLVHRSDDVSFEGRLRVRLLVRRARR